MHHPSVPYNKLLTNLASSSRTGEYWPSVVLYGPRCARSVLPRPRANIPRYGPRARLVNRNNIFEENSLKAFLRQSFRVFDFSNLSSDSRYLESVTLKCLLFRFEEDHFRIEYVAFTLTGGNTKSDTESLKRFRIVLKPKMSIAKTTRH